MKIIQDFIEDETPYTLFKKSLKILEKKNKIKVECTDENFKRNPFTYPDNSNLIINFLDINSNQTDQM